MYFVDQISKGEIGNHKTDNPEISRVIGFDLAPTTEILAEEAGTIAPVPRLTTEQTLALGELGVRKAS